MPKWRRFGRSAVCRASGTYEWAVVGLPYIIVYELNEAADEVAIIAVFHGSQDRDRPEQ